MPRNEMHVYGIKVYIISLYFTICLSFSVRWFADGLLCQNDMRFVRGRCIQVGRGYFYTVMASSWHHQDGICFMLRYRTGFAITNCGLTLV